MMHWRLKLSTVDLLIKGACLAKRYEMFAISKAADLNKLLQGGQPYLAFPFSQGSLPDAYAKPSTSNIGSIGYQPN
jgi:hypothetical protein